MLRTLVNKGIYPELSAAEKRKIRLLNSITIVGIVIVTTFLFLSIFTPADPSTQTEDIISQLVNWTMFMSIYVLSIYRKHLAARIFLIIWFSLFMASLAIIVGITYTASYVALLPISLMVIFLFDKWSQIIPLFLYCTFGYVLVILNHKYTWIKPMPIGVIEHYNAFYIAECFMMFFLIFVIGWLFKSEHEVYEKEINRKNEELEIQKQDIISSIEYSQKIQQAILPHHETIARNIPLSFILYKPKQIVSGDFYWFHEIDRDNYIIICADCTGHGIPGAFMTVICCTVLNQVIIENKNYTPANILTDVDDIISFTLRQETNDEEHIRDGMDLSMIAVNKSEKEIRFTSAKRPAFFVRDGNIQDLKGSKVSIGGLREGKKAFEETLINYQENDLIYLYTDGMTDQFGGPDNKKFMTRRLRDLVQSCISLPIEEQKKKMDREFENWRGNYEQTDDVCVIGIKF